MATTSKATKTKQPDGRTATRLVVTHNDLPDDVRQEMIQLLNAQLADTFDLFSQTKQAHWNVKGPDFIQLHELYDELAAKLLDFVDMIAERATALGGVATGTARMAASASRLAEFTAAPVSGPESIHMLVERYAALARSSRQAIDQSDQAGDMDTNDLFIEISRELDKSLWFLEAHIQMDE
jgi:starvation-inducible DNA-binding protein